MYYVKRDAADETPVFFDCDPIVGWITANYLNLSPAIRRKLRIT